MTIELDGGQHAQQEQEDAARTLEIARRSYRAASDIPSPPFLGEREGPIAQQWEGEVGSVGALQSPPLPG
jgi:hypothetical protein